MLVKPMNTQDLLVQIEALLVTHEDKKRHADNKHLEFVDQGKTAAKKARSAPRKIIAAR
jgi:hypothetical protein